MYECGSTVKVKEVRGVCVAPTASAKSTTAKTAPARRRGGDVLVGDIFMNLCRRFRRRKR